MSNLPKGEVARTIAEDRKNPDLLYLGTETGLWVSWNKGGQWTRLKANLPTIPIYEIKTHPRDNDMILATHARGIWILDDPGISAVGASIGGGGDAFVARSRWRSYPANDQMKGFEGDRLFLGMNPAPGATLAYRLKADAKEVKWTIRDRRRPGDAGDRRRRHDGSQQGRAQPREVGPARGTAQSAPTAPGAPPGAAGRWWWLLRRDQQRALRPARHLSRRALRGRQGRPNGNVAVTGDPDVEITDADRKVWFETAMDLQRLQQKANDAAELAQNANAQLQQLQQQTKAIRSRRR